jgi:hypothetical protein
VDLSQILEIEHNSSCTTKEGKDELSLASLGICKVRELKS